MIVGLAGNDPIGIGISAACVTPLAMAFQLWVADLGHIQDPLIRNEVLFDFTLNMFLRNSVYNGFVFGAGAYFNELFTLTAPILATVGAGRMLAEALWYVVWQVLQ